jgi:hypothetical protein
MIMRHILVHLSNPNRILSVGAIGTDSARIGQSEVGRIQLLCQEISKLLLFAAGFSLGYAPRPAFSLCTTG